MPIEAVFGDQFLDRSEIALALGRLRAKLEEDLWQSIEIVDKDECGCTTLKTATEIVARIKFQVTDGCWTSASIRTNLLAKYQTIFHEFFTPLSLSFERLQPYLEHR